MIRKLLCAALFLGALAAQAQEILYKGTRLGVPEKAFIAEHSNEGFVCTLAPSKVERWCTSNAATYLNFPTTTTAIFIRDRLAGLSISFADPKDLVTAAALDVLIVSQMESVHGQPTLIEWPAEIKNGVQVWKKEWKKKDGSSILYIHGKGSLIEQRSVLITSSDGESLSREAYRSIKPDM